jgi:hypothetical protein
MSDNLFRKRITNFLKAHNVDEPDAASAFIDECFTLRIGFDPEPESSACLNRIIEKHGLDLDRMESGNPSATRENVLDKSTLLEIAQVRNVLTDGFRSALYTTNVPLLSG